MDLIIVSGMSGAGKSTCLNALEDLGFYCMDNILPQLIPDAVQAMVISREKIYEGFRIAISADARVGEFFSEIYSALDKIKIQGFNYQLLFLDAEDDVLINRFNETKRAHPLAKGLPIYQAIEKERKLLKDLKNSADIIIDTTSLDIKGLKQKVYDAFESIQTHQGVAIVTFGYKRGIPKDCDIVFDVRFLDNPHYIKELKDLTGKDPQVQEFVFRDGRAEEYCRHMLELLLFVLRDYHKEVKQLLTVGIGCTGGKHRSVALAERLKLMLSENGYNVETFHRNLLME
ncbi:MAG TPA: RNase adapter RapZ [Clostridiales bacterium]|nr:RNase adapter RapZ [Clostridiales bacterium]